ncbi:MAG: DMT family transporter [Dermatophilaceae bacterium]
MTSDRHGVQVETLSPRATGGALGRLARSNVGLLTLLASSVAFASSGPFAKSLLTAGWTPGAVVLARVGLGALVLLGPAVRSLRGRWWTLRDNLGLLVGYGVAAVGGSQVAFFAAVGRLPVGVALLVEYLGVVLVVGWVWARSGRAPSRTTTLGVALALAGLALVIDVSGAGAVDVLGLGLAALSAVGLAVYFVVSARAGTALAPAVLACGGMVVGTALLLAAGLTGILPLRATTSAVVIAGATVPWWVPVIELGFVAAAAAYLLGTYGARRLGSTVASFVGLTEVLFAVVLAWALLGEIPRPVQLAGGAVVLGGVAAVRAGELRRR